MSEVLSEVERLILLIFLTAHPSGPTFHTQTSEIS